MDGYFSFDPIYALATPPIKSAIAVFRVSGKGCIALLNMALDKPIDLNSKSFVSSKALFYRKILLSDKSILDDCLVSVFKDGSGYTKEEAAEISVHGSLAVISALDDLFLKTGFRKALKGEFTFRAMQNGRLTLLESEAVLELIDSDSEVMRKNASLRLSGALDKKLNSIYEELLEISSIFELQMDYSDDEFDEDVSFPKEKIDIVKNKIIKLLQSFQISRKEEDGIKIVLLGDTNAGKSTLVSSLSSAKPKIANYPFTTLEPSLGIVPYRDGQSFVMADIPGIIEGASEGKGLGLRFLRHIERNSLLLFMVPGDADDIAKEYQILLDELTKFNPELLDKQRILAITKVDMLDDELVQMLEETLPTDIPHVFISSVTGTGIATLKDMLWAAMNSESNKIAMVINKENIYSVYSFPTEPQTPPERPTEPSKPTEQKQPSKKPQQANKSHKTKPESLYNIMNIKDKTIFIYEGLTYIFTNDPEPNKQIRGIFYTDTEAVTIYRDGTSSVHSLEHQEAEHSTTTI